MKVALVFLLGSVLIAGFAGAAPAGEEEFDAFTTDLRPEDAEVSPRVHPHLHHGLWNHHGLHGGLHGGLHSGLHGGLHSGLHGGLYGGHGLHGLHGLHGYGHHGLHHGLHHHHPLLHHHGLVHHHHALHHHPHHHHHTKKLLLFKIKKLLPHHHMLHVLPHLAHHHHLHHGFHHHGLHHHGLHHHFRANGGIDSDSLIPVIPASGSAKPGYQLLNPEGGQSYIQLFADNPTGQTYSIPSELTPTQNLEAVEEIDGEGERDGNYENLELEDISENAPRRPLSSIEDMSYQTPLIYYAGPQPVEYGRSVSPTKDKSIFKN